MPSIRVAFASPTHARAALGFLAEAEFAWRPGAISGGTGGDYAFVDFEVGPGDVSRLRCLLTGVHGIVLEEKVSATSAVA